MVPLKEKTKAWWNDERVGPLEAFPILFVYSIWEARNKTIFNNTWIPPDIAISLLMRKIQEHKRDIAKNKIRIIRMRAEINKEIPWAFFNGASQWEPHLGGAGDVIFFPSTKKMKMKFATGKSSKNKAELSAYIYKKFRSMDTQKY